MSSGRKRRKVKREEEIMGGRKVYRYEDAKESDKRQEGEADKSCRNDERDT